MLLCSHLRRVRLRESNSPHNILNPSFSRFFSLSNPANAKKEPPSEEEKKLIERKKKERKKEYDRIRETKPEIKEKRKESARKYYEKPENKEKIKERFRKYKEKPENKEKMRKRRIQYEEKPENKEKMRKCYIQYKEKPENKEKIPKRRLARYIQKKEKINPGYVYIPRKKLVYNWRDQESVKSFFEKVGKKLKIFENSQWYHVSTTQIRENGGSGAFSRHKSLGFALKFAYPDYEWDMELFQYSKKLAAQRWLLLMLKELIPKDIVPHFNFTKDPALYLEGSKFPSQYDIFIKEWRLAIEYQGEQHYLDIRPEKAPLLERQKKDAIKLKSAVKHGITLVEIPYWWDKKSDSLSSTLNQFMPERFPKTDSPPVPTELPADYQKIKKSGILTNKKIMHGYDIETCVDEIDVKGWFMSEKLDGIRAYWDGEGNFWSKNAKIINVPESFKQLPPYPLDGELWGGYEENNESTLALLKLCCGNVIKKTSKLEWAKIKFCVFDAPNVEGTYYKRHLFLKNNLTEYCNSNISVIPMHKCKGKDHLEKHLEEIVKKGGEGIMIYNPKLPYQPGRCKNVLKVKKYYESKITFLERSNMSHSFKCRQDDGSVFWLKVTGGYWMRKPEVGSKIPVKHQGFFANSQKLKYPVLYEPLSTQEKKEARKQAKKQPNANIE